MAELTFSVMSGERFPFGNTGKRRVVQVNQIVWFEKLGVYRSCVDELAQQVSAHGHSRSAVDELTAGKFPDVDVLAN
jgi:hypothetical protein